jgi:hypothetical protein
MAAFLIISFTVAALQIATALAMFQHQVIMFQMAGITVVTEMVTVFHVSQSVNHQAVWMSFAALRALPARE